MAQFVFEIVAGHLAVPADDGMLGKPRGHCILRLQLSALYCAIVLQCQQSVQDRAEMLRNLAFTDLTDATAVQTLMLPAPNAAPFAQKATETVTISAFPTPNGVTQFTRTPAGTVTTDSVATDLGKELVKVDVKVAWTMTLGGRSRTEQTTNILSNGSKK